VRRHHLRRDRKSKSGAVRLPGDEWIEEPSAHLRRNSGPIVLNLDFERRRRPLPIRMAGLMPEGRGDHDFTAVVASRPRRFCCVLNQIEEDLNELVFIAKHRRKGWVVGGSERQSLSNAVDDKRANPVENAMNIDGLEIESTGIGKGLKPLDQTSHPIGFIHDQLCER